MANQQIKGMDDVLYDQIKI